MRIKYVIHDYAGLRGAERTFEVSGEIAQLLYDQYADKPGEIGVTILEVDYEEANNGNETV